MNVYQDLIVRICVSCGAKAFKGDRMFHYSNCVVWPNLGQVGPVYGGK